MGVRDRRGLYLVVSHLLTTDLLSYYLVTTVKVSRPIYPKKDVNVTIIK